MTEGRLTVALVSDTFPLADDADRLRQRLEEAKKRGAEVAVLPELPLDSWLPAGRQPRDEDAEPPEGPRYRCQSTLAREVGIALVGGAIVRDSQDGGRHSTAFVFGRDGSLLGSWEKAHLPEEPGFWETDHYEPGRDAPSVVPGLGLDVAVQVCSDINRPEVCHVLGAMGAEAVLVPRATERRTYDRWRTVFRANAMTSAVYVLSVNRPLTEGAGIGGPSVAVDPNGDVILETEEAVALVTLERSVIDDARVRYPGYLPVRADLYAEAWRSVASGRARAVVTPRDAGGARGTRAGRAS